MATSTIPAAIDALLTALRASEDLADPVKVVDGYPRFRITNIDLVSVGGKDEPVASGEQTPAALGGQRREERYSLAVYCSSSRGGEDQKTVRDRAFALMAAVEDVLRADGTLGGVVRFAQVGGGITLLETDADTAPAGVFAEVGFLVDVQARI